MISEYTVMSKWVFNNKLKRISQRIRIAYGHAGMQEYLLMVVSVEMSYSQFAKLGRSSAHSKL